MVSRLPSCSYPFNWTQAQLGIPETYILTNEVEPGLSQGRHTINRSLAAAETALMCGHNGTRNRSTDNGARPRVSRAADDSQQQPHPNHNPEEGWRHSLFWLIKGWAIRRNSVERFAPLCKIFIDLRSLNTNPRYCHLNIDCSFAAKADVEEDM
jgi:hypothetical protein